MKHELETLGALTWLAMHSQTHHRMPSGEFMRALKPAMQQKRVLLFFRQAQPHAWLAWSFLSTQSLQEKCQQLAPTQAVAAHDVHTHAPWHVWLDFWVRPYGCDAPLAEAVAKGLQQAWQHIEHLHTEHLHTKPNPAMTLNWFDPAPAQLHVGIPPEQLKHL